MKEGVLHRVEFTVIFRWAEIRFLMAIFEEPFWEKLRSFGHF
jgi:hypothetical protein